MPEIADWEAFSGEARKLGLLPLVDLRADVLKPPREQAREAWVERERIRVRARKLLELCERVLECLDSSGVRASALKGCAHAHDLHRDVSLRFFSDVDVLVPPEEFTRACEALVRMGLRPEPPWPRRGYSMRVHYERGFLAPDCAVDLHRSFYHPRPYRVDYGAVWSRAQKASHGWKLSPEDHFLHACVHQAKESFLAGPAGVFDMCALVRRGLDWDLIAKEATNWRCRVAVGVSLRILEEFAGVRLPEEARRSFPPITRLRRGLVLINPAEPPFLSPSCDRFAARRRTALALCDSALDGVLYGVMYASRRLLDLFSFSPPPAEPRKRDAQEIQPDEAKG